jgi:hypothetical protein
MRRLAIPAIVLALHSFPAIGAQQTRPMQADAVVRLLTDVEGALTSGRIEDFRPLASSALPDADARRFERLLNMGPAETAVVRERGRRPVGGGYEVLAEVLLGHGQRGRLATWQLGVRPVAGDPERFELISFAEQASVDGLIRLTMDTTRQFELRDFLLEAPDLRLEMSSGSAFVAESPSGITAIVLRGRGRVSFTPPDQAEQGQLRLYDGRPTFVSDVDSAFIRLNPGELSTRIDSAGLVPAAAVDPAELRRAQDIFDQYSARTYNLDLSDLGSDRWSLEPAFGSLLVEMRARRKGWLTYSRSPGEPEDISLFDRENGRNISVYASTEKLAQRGPDYSEDDDATYDVERYGLDLTFDPARSWISGRGSLRIRIKRELVSTLTLKLAEPLSISSVSAVEYGRLLTLRVIGQNNVIVSLPRPAPRGTVLVLDVAYSGRLEPQSLNREAIAPDGQAGTAQDSQRGEYTILLPETRYMYSNRLFWYPQGETSDYATAAMRLTVPSEFQVVASGTFVGASISEQRNEVTGEVQSRRTVEYSADRPARYLACVISRFVPIEQVRVPVPAVAAVDASAPGDGAAAPAPAAPFVEVEVVSTPRMTARNRQMPERVAGIIGFYAKTVGEAPYPNFTLAGIDDNLPGGHSPAFFAVLHQPLPTTPYVWGSDPVAFDHIYTDFFLAHEVAHQWWGQAVGWKNYHEQWLSEGLSQYFAVLFAASERGPELADRLLEQMQRSAAPLTNRGPISLGYRLGHIHGEGRIFRAIVYNKSAVVLHMLRRLIGDDAFFAGIRDFYAKRRFDKAGTNDLQAALQAHTPRPLERFFRQWIRGATLPRLQVSSRVDTAKRVAVVRVQQRDEVFDVPLRVEVQYQDGRSELVVLKVSQADEEFSLPVSGDVRRVQVRDEIVLARIEG